MSNYTASAGKYSHDWSELEWLISRLPRNGQKQPLKKEEELDLAKRIEDTYCQLTSSLCRFNHPQYVPHRKGLFYLDNAVSQIELTEKSRAEYSSQTARIKRNPSEKKLQQQIKKLSELLLSYNFNFRTGKDTGRDCLVTAARSLYNEIKEKKPLKKTKEEIASALAERNEHRQFFMQSNLGLVISVAKGRYHSKSTLSLADLIGEGCIGLAKAVDLFDYRRNCKFSTYAVWWIKHEITRAQQDKGRQVRMPVWIHELMGRYFMTAKDLELKNRQPPTPTQILEEMAPHEMEFF